MAHNIVTVNVTQTIAATPNTLQEHSAFLSFGSTLQPVGIPALITQASDLADLVNNAIGTLVSDGTTATLTLPEGESISRDAGSQIDITLSGCSPTIWNGTYTATLADEGTLTWDTTIAAGSPTTVGTFSLAGSDDLTTAVDTFFAQNPRVGTYMLELGYTDGAVKSDTAALKVYIEEPLLAFYGYQVPKEWDQDEDFLMLAKQYESPTSKLYFFILTAAPESATSPNLYSGTKSIVSMSDDSYPETYAVASILANVVSASPSSVNKVPPMSYRYLYGVNANQAKSSVLSTMEKNYINYVGTGAEGGISNTILMMGVASDGNDFTYWYAADWTQINADQTVANTVINGSNDPTNPLYYDQDGIDRIQIAAQGVLNSGVSYGLLQGSPVVSAVPYSTYITQNPNDYSTGRYAGLSCTITPKRGFTSITFNINVTMTPTA
ncbi:hypothetical protein K2B09_003048 [Salmonella enterica subsp. enterica]|nr:hypothetical protein [Salmonella enterica subsp. enterica]EHW9181800.1 hypothetical protein [Salmonella enterica subsp. enterica]